MTAFSKRMFILMMGFLSCGFGIAMMIKAHLGLGPWDIFHQGLHLVFGISIGTATVFTGAGVLLLWIPFKQKPGLGTILNMLLIGPSADFALYVLPEPFFLPTRIAFLGFGLPLMAFGTALYLSSQLGAGPRDGLMLAITRHFNISIRLARTLVECSAFVGGWLMGGTYGIGSIYFAFLIGPMVQFIIEAMKRFGYWHSAAVKPTE